LSEYFVHASDGPVRAAEEVQALQPNVRITNVEPLYRSNGRQGRRKGKPLWKVYHVFKDGEE
jgi:hypothetical protein